MKIFILAPCLILLMLTGVSAIEASPVGCEYYNSTTIICHNQGDVEPVTFVESNGINLYNNNTNRSGWVEYDWGFEWTTNRGINKSVSWNDLPNVTPQIRSDNLSYWSINWTKNVKIGLKRANLTLLMGQLLNDSEVELKAMIITGDDGWEAWNKTVRLYRTMNMTNIDLDGDEDFLQVEYKNKTRIAGMNITNDTKLYSLDTNYVLVYDDETEHTISWRWNSQAQVDYHAQLKANPGSNALLYWVANSSILLESNKTYRLRHYWIDATSQINPQSNKTGYILFNGLFKTAYSGAAPQVKKYKSMPSENRGFTSYDTSNIPDNAFITRLEWRHVFVAKTVGGPVDWISDLYMGEWISEPLNGVDWGGGSLTKTLDWSDYCVGNSPCSYTFDLPSGAFKYVNTTGYTDIALRDASLWDFSSPSYWSHSYWGNAGGRSSWLKVTYDFINITLSTPPDNIIVMDHFVNLSCNWTTVEPDNITVAVYHVHDLFYNETNSSGENVTVLTPELHDHHLWKWNCYACSGGDCVWSVNGNWSFTVNFDDDTLWRLTAPPNQSRVNNLNATQELTCDVIGDVHDEIANISLYVNDTVQHVVYNTTELAYNYTFTAPGVYEWDCLYQLHPFPPPPPPAIRWSDNGNYTVIRVADVSTTPPPVHVQKSAEKKESSFLIIVFIILFGVVLVFLIKSCRRKDE